jgi:hypothetical protein
VGNRIRQALRSMASSTPPADGAGRMVVDMERDGNRGPATGASGKAPRQSVVRHC